MTAWQTLYLSDDEAAASCYGKSVRFFMKSGIYTGFSFWHPAREINKLDDKAKKKWLKEHL